MESYDNLKAEKESIKHLMAEAKKNERVNALRGVKHLCKDFSFTTGMLKDPLTSGCGEECIKF